MARAPMTYREAIDRGVRFWQTRGRLPTRKEVTDKRVVETGLPNYMAVRKLFGGVAGYEEELVRAVEALQRREQSPKRKLRDCLKCDRVFTPLPVDERICKTCKNADDWGDTSDWLSGVDGADYLRRLMRRGKPLGQGLWFG